MNDDLGLATQFVEGVLMENLSDLQRKLFEIEQKLYEQELREFVIYEEPDLEDL